MAGLALLSSYMLVTTSAGIRQADVTPPDRSFDEVVVTARPSAPPPIAEPIRYFRRHCFDAARLTGAPAPPENDPYWTALDEESRRKFGAADPSIPAYGLNDERRGHILLIKVERLPPSRRWRTVEDRCTLVVIGGDHGKLLGGMSELWRASGTQRNLEPPDDRERPAGWRRWYWSGMPTRGSKDWRAHRRDGDRSFEAAALRVIDPRFYAEHDYIIGDLRTRRDAGPPVSVLTFARVYRPVGPRTKR